MNSTPKILLTDDSPMNLELLKRYIAGEGLALLFSMLNNTKPVRRLNLNSALEHSKSNLN